MSKATTNRHKEEPVSPNKRSITLPLSAFIRYEVTTHLRAPLICLGVVLLIEPFVLALVEGWREFIVDQTSWSVRTADMLLFVWVNVFAHVFWYIAMGGSMLLCDRMQWLQQYKIPRKPNTKNKPELLATTIKDAIHGQFVSQPLGLVIMYFTLVDGKMELSQPTVTWSHCLFHLICARVVTEFLVYWEHRLTHEIPQLYAYHKFHHKYLDSIGFAAEYTHPVDGILTALASIAYSLYNLQSYSFTMWLVGTNWLYVETYAVHIGYSFRGSLPHRWFGLMFAERSAFHDWHHTDNVGNYGSAFLWDYVFGTCQPYLRHMANIGQLRFDSPWSFLT